MNEVSELVRMRKFKKMWFGSENDDVGLLPLVKTVVHISGRPQNWETNRQG